jgi:hypothetical protein
VGPRAGLGGSGKSLDCPARSHPLSYTGPHSQYTQFPKSAIVNISFVPALMRRAENLIPVNLITPHGQKLLFAGTGRDRKLHDPVVSSPEKEPSVSNNQEGGRAPDPVWRLRTKDNFPVYC